MHSKGINIAIRKLLRPASKALKASSLLYTVSICLLVALMLSAMVLLFGYNRLSTDWAYHLELAQDNLESGRTLVLYDGEHPYGDYRGSLFDSAVDSYHVETRPWGAYGLLIAEGVHGKARKRQASLYGIRPQGVLASALHLRGGNRPLVLAGETRLQGDLYLPEAGIKPGFVGRTGFSGPQLYEGKVRSSDDFPSGISYESLSDVTKRLQALEKGALPPFSAVPQGASAHADWEVPTLELGSPAAIQLTGVSLSGNAIITAREVIIASDCQLTDVLVFARTIRVREGFKGRIQLFALDSLVIEPRCHLQYPSAAVLGCKEDWGYLQIGEESLLEGLLLTDADLLAPGTPTRSYTLLQRAGHVVGTAIVANNFDLQGEVTGTVITSGFRLVTSGAVYENHLLDAAIHQQGLSPRYAMPILTQQPAEYQEITPLPQRP